MNEAVKEIKFHRVEKIEKEKLVEEKQLAIFELNEKFRDIKSKVLKKLQEKDKKIAEYTASFNEIDKKLNNFNDISKIGLQ